MIVDRDEESWDGKPTVLTNTQSELIGKFDGRGVARCRRHDLPMRRVTYEFVGPKKRRELGLQPGEHADPHAFRLRLECTADDPCQVTRFDNRRALPGVPSKVHLYMEHGWSALSAFPHTIEGGGQKREHAFRLAMYARRNTVESLFSALKGHHKLGLAGPARTRTDNEPVVDLLISLALLSRTASAVAEAREVRGLHALEPPPGVVKGVEDWILAA